MKVRSCMVISLTIMTLTGVWTPKFVVPNKLRFVYYGYSIIYHVFIVIPLVYMELAHFVLVMGDMEKMVEASLLLLSHLTHCIKIFNLWRQQGEIRNLLDLLESPIFSKEDPEEKNILQYVIQRTYFMSKFYISIILITCIFWGIYPMLRPNLGLPLFYPYLDPDSYWFWICYFFQTLTIFCAGSTIASADFLAGSLMYLISSHQDILIYELSFVGKQNKPESLTNISKNDKSISLTKAESDYDLIISCIKFHLEIINFIKRLDNTFGLPVFFQFLSSAIIICETAFRITVCKEPTEILTMSFYLFCLFAELLMFCYFGDIVKRKSELLVREAYCSHWEDTSVPVQKALLMLIIRSQNMPTLTAGNMFEMSLMTFSSILKTSYSYFTVLKNHNS